MTEPVTVDVLVDPPYPVIIGTGLLGELGPAGVVVGDPATGIVNWSVPLLARCFTGSLLLFDPPEG